MAECAAPEFKTRSGLSGVQVTVRGQGSESGSIVVVVAGPDYPGPSRGAEVGHSFGVETLSRGDP